MLPFLAFLLVKHFFFFDEFLNCCRIFVKVVELIDSEVAMMPGDLLRVEVLHVVFDGEESPIGGDEV